MGNKVAIGSPLPREEIDELCGRSRFHRREIRQLHSQFSGEAPGGQLTRQEFASLAESMGLKERALIEVLFTMLDRNRDGHVSFSDYVMAMSVLARGTAEENMDLAFSAMDTHRQGMVSREEAQKLSEALVRALSELTEPLPVMDGFAGTAPDSAVAGAHPSHPHASTAGSGSTPVEASPTSSA
eukprot:RCo051033